jgi:hypothetical protein
MSMIYEIITIAVCVLCVCVCSVDVLVYEIWIIIFQKHSEVVPVFNEDVWRSGGMAWCIVSLDTGWRWVVSFMCQPLYPHRKSLWYQLDMRLGGPQSFCLLWRRENSLAPARNWTLIPQSSSPYPCLDTSWTILAPCHFPKGSLNS